LGFGGAALYLRLRDAGIKSTQDLLRQALLKPDVAKELIDFSRGKGRMLGLKRYSMFEASALSGDRKEEQR
jgi:hypothetical protein